MSAEKGVGRKRTALILACILSASVIFCACTFRRRGVDTAPDTTISAPNMTIHTSAYDTSADAPTDTAVDTINVADITTFAETETAPPPVTEPPATTERETTAPPVTEPPVSEPPVSDTTADTEPLVIEDSYAIKAAADYKKITDRALRVLEGHRRSDSGLSYSFMPVDRRPNLEAPAQIVYDMLYESVSKLEPLIFDEELLAYISVEDIRTASMCFFENHPEWQYFAYINEVRENGAVTKMELRYFLPADGTDITYSDKSELRAQIAYFEAVCDYIVSVIPGDYSTYDKYLYLACIISLTTNYDREHVAEYNHSSAYAGIVGGLSICEGYAVGFEYLCRKADLWCERVEGASFASETHMWNLVKLESGTYHVDVTWSDTGGAALLGPGWMRYFMITQNVVRRDHLITDGTVATGK